MLWWSLSTQTCALNANYIVLIQFYALHASHEEISGRSGRAAASNYRPRVQKRRRRASILFELWDRRIARRRTSSNLLDTSNAWHCSSVAFNALRRTLPANILKWTTDCMQQVNNFLLTTSVRVFLCLSFFQLHPPNQPGSGACHFQQNQINKMHNTFPKERIPIPSECCRPLEEGLTDWVSTRQC